jgi:hypothetical protein
LIFIISYFHYSDGEVLPHIRGNSNKKRKRQKFLDLLMERLVVGMIVRGMGKRKWLAIILSKSSSKEPTVYGAFFGSAVGAKSL